MPDADSISSREREDARQVLAELGRRKKESLRLYVPLDFQDAFHKSRASERVLRKGNRAGGTTTAAVEVARAATGQDPYNKYPDRPLTIWVIGLGLSHIGRVIHRILFRPGAFRMVRDPETKEWRTFQPWRDEAIESQAVEAEPLIPSRFIEDIAWYNKGERQFSVVRLTNGTEIRAFSSESDTPPMGDPVDLIWVDEDVAHPYWIPELQGRLSDKKGRLIWSAAPLANNDAMIDMCERANQQYGMENPDVEEFRATFSGNPYIDADEKRKRLAGWDEDERCARDLGEFLTDSRLMYPTFSLPTHGISKEQYNEWDQCRDWCRYAVIDPGHAVCCILLGAISPPKLGDIAVVEEVVYIHNCDADKFAMKMAEKTMGRSYHSFIIDMHGSASSDAGTGKSIRQQYTEALRKHRVRSEVTGSGFSLASDDVNANATAVRGWLRPQADGEPKLRIFAPQCKPLVDDFGRYRKKMNKDRIVEDKPDPRSRLRCHAANTVEYFAAANPRYHKPKKSNTRSLLAKQRLTEKKQLKKRAFARGELTAAR